MIGSQAARTRRSAAAFAAISGPMPAGSPAVIATRGLAMAAAGPATTGAAACRVVAAALTAAPTVLDARRVRQLVAQAALQAAAQPRQLRRVEAQSLLLGQLARDRLERVEERRASQR